MRKIKLAMIANNLVLNGISNVIMKYCVELSKDKYEIHIIAGEPISPFHEKEARENGIRIWKLPSRKRKSVQYYPKLWKILNQEKFDIAHIHGNSATITVELFLAWLSGTRVRIAHSHNTECMHHVIHELQYPLFASLYTNGFACGEMAGKWLFRKKPFEVIPNGFHTERFAFNKENRMEIRSQLKLGDTDYLIGHIGRFNDQKNHPFLLEIFEQVADINPNARLLLVGTGPDYDKVMELIEKHKYKNKIIVYGETNEPEKLYSAMDIFALPSKYEGLGIVALEAQISGLPCVVSDAVPSEARISNSISYVSLNDKSEWTRKLSADNVLDDQLRTESYSLNRKQIEQYEIGACAKRLDGLYSLYISGGKA